ncbi:MAG: cation diffusion facilitator family transporter [Deltaproteobacteria bacterium]|nr:cation diffusion facilitator family transporter [Deltaproteobacteria bacterium]
MSSENPTGHIIQSLAVNAAIAAAKTVAAVITGSGAMLAESLHSFADCGNQLLLLMGVHKARKPADAQHPLGYGRDLYFWSFMVALLLFTGGGVFSIYEGIHKFREPEPVGPILVAVIILALSIALEGWSCWSNIVELNKRRGAIPFFQYLRETKDSDLVVIFGENAAAVLGLALAMGAVLMAKETGDGRWDAVGSLAIGVVLVGVALFLAKEIKSLLLGEAADPVTEKSVREIVAADPNVERLLRMMSIQQGPGEVVVALKLKFKSGLTTGGELCKVINDLEARIEAQHPEVKWTFVEPDVTD